MEEAYPEWYPEALRALGWVWRVLQGMGSGPHSELGVGGTCVGGRLYPPMCPAPGFKMQATGVEPEIWPEGGPICLWRGSVS